MPDTCDHPDIDDDGRCTACGELVGEDPGDDDYPSKEPAMATTATAKRQPISHKDHDHEATTAARKLCREAMAEAAGKPKAPTAKKAPAKKAAPRKAAPKPEEEEEDLDEI